MKTQKVFEQHTINVKDGIAFVSTVTVTERKIELKSDDGIFCMMRKLHSWNPSDNWCHVVAQLKNGKTYISRKGPILSAHFTDR